MSDQMTSVRIGKQGGLAGYGKLDRKTMIERYRQMARKELERANEILAASDDDFVVEQFVGIHVRKNLKVIAP